MYLCVKFKENDGGVTGALIYRIWCRSLSVARVIETDIHEAADNKHINTLSINNSKRTAGVTSP